VDSGPVVDLECRDVTVTYGDVVALKGVSVAFEPRRIHAVVGQNGAGKTTFARVCAGIVRPVSGELRIAGQPVPTGKVNQARASGVELVHQSFALPPSFTVAEAMEFGSQAAGGKLYTRRALEARWAPHLESLDIKVRLRDRIRDLPIETQQAVEIARALVAKARVLILDEPTAVLSPSGIETLFGRLRGLRDAGVTIILILHKIRCVAASWSKARSRPARSTRPASRPPSSVARRKASTRCRAMSKTRWSAPAARPTPMRSRRGARAASSRCSS
jgi:simple sugar transport system ATP-binding protein